MQGSFRIQLINMGTRAAAFTAKIRSLYDYQLRLMHNLQPLPSGNDIANTVKYFSQTLLSVLKDVPNSPLELIRDPSKDELRMGLYPNLDYKGLFNAISQLVDSAPHIQYGVQAFGSAVLQCLGCLLPFLEYDMIDSLPYLVAYCVAVFPAALHQQTLDLLTYYILPFTITRQYDGDEEENQAAQSVAAILMMVFQHSNNPALHCQLLECLMSMKSSVVSDVLCVVAYGTSGARLCAAKLLFYYWPPFDPQLCDRKGLICKFNNERVPFVCQRDNCPNAGVAEAAKVCYDHCISVTFASERPPPLYLCIECANEIHREHPEQRFFDILHPTQQVSLLCENKNCRSTDKFAYSICFSPECASYNGNHPIRYCRQCHGNRHNSGRGGDHVTHARLSAAAHTLAVRAHAALSLMREAAPLPRARRPDPVSLDDRQLLGRYGVWLVVGLFGAAPSLPDEVLAALLEQLAAWFQATAHAYSGEALNSVEKLKWEHVCAWLRDTARARRHVLLAVLTKPDLATLSRLYCLIPYGVITQDLWDDIMPAWMEILCNNKSIPEKDLLENKTVVGKVFERDVPLPGVEEGAMFRFAAARLAPLPGADPPRVADARPALLWLQRLSFLDVSLPLGQLFDMFSRCVQALPDERVDPPPAEKLLRATGSPARDAAGSGPGAGPGPGAGAGADVAPENLTCCILMLDILLKQLELQRRRATAAALADDVTRLLRLMLQANHENTVAHAHCLAEGACGYCSAAALCHQLAVQLVSALAPHDAAPAPATTTSQGAPEEVWWEARASEEEGREGRETREGREPRGGGRAGGGGSSVEALLALGAAPERTVGGALVHMPHFVQLMQMSVLNAAVDDSVLNAKPNDDQIMTATVESISEQLDMGLSLAPEPRAAPDLDLASANTSSPRLGGSGAGGGGGGGGGDGGRGGAGAGSPEPGSAQLSFNLEELPEPLQYVHQLLVDLKSTSRPDVLYHLLQCLHVMVIRVGALQQHRGFLVWCQQRLLIDNLWLACGGHRAQLAWRAVPVLLAAARAEPGADVLCAILRAAFTAPAPPDRFAAVERAAALLRWMAPDAVTGSLPLQSALSTALCWLAASCGDPDVFVAQRAALYLTTLHDAALHLLMYCLETQFDLVAADRAMILQAVYQLHNTLSDRKILSWQFFLNRFEALTLEAHISSNKSTDLATLRELLQTETSAARLGAKLRRAQAALGARRPPRAPPRPPPPAPASAPAAPAAAAAAAASVPLGATQREKVYPRQYSAPLLKRKTSRLGLAQLLTAPPPVSASSRHLAHEPFPSLGGRGAPPPPPPAAAADAERETINLLVCLLMQFMSRSEQAHPTEEKCEARAQDAVLRHLFASLGYCAPERRFLLAPHALRQSPAFNAFMSSLPQLLDQNHLMGGVVLDRVLHVLQYCTASGGTYSLTNLGPHVSRHWLMAVLLVLYKYPFTRPSTMPLVQGLIQVVLGGVRSYHHECTRAPPAPAPAPAPAPPAPPASARPQSTEATAAASAAQPPDAARPDRPDRPDTRLQHRSHDKFGEWSVEAESSESSLLAIPETSDKSDATPHNSTAPGSFDEPSHGSDRGEPAPPLRAGGGGSVGGGGGGSAGGGGGARPAQLLSTSSSVSVGSDSSHMKSTPMSGHSAQSAVTAGADSSASPEHDADTLFIPPTERLLRIGGSRSTPAAYGALADRVREALSLPPDPESTDKTDSSRSESEPPRPQDLNKMLSTEVSRSRGGSPRRLSRQAALRSPGAEPPPAPLAPLTPAPLTAAESYRFRGWWSQATLEERTAAHAPRHRHAAATIPYRCAECGVAIEPLGDEAAGLACIALATLVHRHKPAAGEWLPHILLALSRAVRLGHASWQAEWPRRVAPSAAAVAQQLLRCLLHHLAPNNVFLQIFTQRTPPPKQRQMFFKSIAQSFVDFTELYPSGPLQLLCEHVASSPVTPEQMVTIGENIALYLESVSPEALGPAAACGALLAAAELFLRAAAAAAPALPDCRPLLRAATLLLRVPGAAQCKSILEPISKLVSYGVQSQVIPLALVSELSDTCRRVFARDRDRLLVSRVLMLDLMQALRTKVTLPSDNTLMLLQFLLQGYGCTLVSGGLSPAGAAAAAAAGPGGELGGGPGGAGGAGAGAGGALGGAGPPLAAVLDLLAEPRPPLASKHDGGKCSGGGRHASALAAESAAVFVRAGAAQYAAIQLALEHEARRAAAAPAIAHASVREAGDATSSARLLCWVLCGALCNAGSAPSLAQHAACRVADRVQSIMSCYVERAPPAAPPAGLAALGHAFALCQLWTLYLQQQLATTSPASDMHYTAGCILLDFWCKVVPSVLQVTVQSKLLAETVNMHFLSLLESLLESPAVLNKLLPLWTPILYSPMFSMPRHVWSRVAAVRELRPRAAPPRPAAAPPPPRRARLLARVARLDPAHNHFYII